MDEEEVIEVSDVEFYELGFKIGLSWDVVCPRGTSERYYSMALSPDERYMAFYVFMPESDDRKLAVWDIVRKEILVSVSMPRIKKLEFMPTENKIVVLRSKKGICGEDVSIFDLSGELVKCIDFPYKTDAGRTAYGDIDNFAVSPDSKRIALLLYSLLIYDLKSDEVINRISREDLGRISRKCWGYKVPIRSRRLFWPKRDGLVVTVDPKCLGIEHDDMEEFRQYPLMRAVMVDPYTKEVRHKVPIKYTSSLEYSDAYFVSPDGEYLAVVNKYIYLPRFSDFDARGRYVGKGSKWRPVKKYRTTVTHVGWSPNSTELIYQYGNGFVTVDYVKNEVTRLIVSEELNGIETSRIFWLRNNTIYFVNDREPFVVGVLRL
ncbi:MAG: hypothetical protein J7L47_10610 [Candidatus Odinarchaeota archaeon]|nr:hypothetical protein [Candidatus Odinarchaeota archaeon]